MVLMFQQQWVPKLYGFLRNIKVYLDWQFFHNTIIDYNIYQIHCHEKPLCLLVI